MNIYVYVYMYSPRYTRVIKLSKSSSSMLSGSAANFRTVVAVPIFVHVSPPSPLSQQSCIEIFREASGHSGLRETYRGSTESEGHGFFEMAARRYPREQRERRNTQDEEDKGGENRRKRGREERRRRRGRGEGGEEEKQKRDLGRPRGSLGLPNWLRKCNGDFYNVRIYTPSYELRTFICVGIYTLTPALSQPLLRVRSRVILGEQRPPTLPSFRNLCQGHARISPTNLNRI